MDLKARVKKFAQSIGVDRLGIASPEDLTGEHAILSDRLSKGTYPPFAEADLDLRCSPKAILPNAESIISVAVSYRVNAPESDHKTKNNNGNFATYARGKDYHILLRDILTKIVTFLSENAPSAKSRIFVDSGPVLEKALAQRAGLGWIGKNSLCNVNGYGSWVVLGTLITTVKLEPDLPVLASKCGLCTACQNACPTGAIVAPFQVDWRKCLSYISQMPGPVPREMRKIMGDRVWGCDACQEACPWNQQVLGGSLPELATPAYEPSQLTKVLSLTNSEFKKEFGESAFSWRGKNTLQRNVAIVLGNAGDPTAIPALASCFASSKSAVTRGACAWALGELGGPEAQKALTAALDTEQDESVREEVDSALKRIAEVSPRQTNGTNAPEL